MSRMRNVVPGDAQTKKLEQLSVAELSLVLKTLHDELPDPAAAEQQVAAVHKRLLQSLKKLDKAFGVS